MLTGHAPQIATLRAAVEAGALHHAWLLAGPPGIGKATFATEAAAWILARAAGPAPTGPGFDLESQHPTARLLAAGSHLDFRRVERILNPNVKPSDATLRKEIAIDQIVRRDDSKFEAPLSEVLRATPALSAMRVVVIDSLDEMNRNAANALLKHLEEPPPGTLFLCVSHAPGRLLPTLRSRCRALRFQPLADVDVDIVLARQLPDASAADRAALVRLAGGAPGRALRFADAGVASLARDLDALPAEPGRAAALARSLAGKAATPRYEAFLELAPAALAARARVTSGPARERAIAAWSHAAELAATAIPLALDPQQVAHELASLVAAPR